MSVLADFLHRADLSEYVYVRGLVADSTTQPLSLFSAAANVANWVDLNDDRSLRHHPLASVNAPFWRELVGVMGGNDHLGQTLSHMHTIGWRAFIRPPHTRNSIIRFGRNPEQSRVCFNDSFCAPCA